MADDETGANPTIAQRLLDGWVKPASAAATTIAAAVAAVFAIWGKNEAEVAAESATAVQQELLQRAEARETRKVDNEYTLQIINRAFESIESNNVPRQRLVLAIVKTIPDKGLASDINSAFGASSDEGVRSQASRQLGELDYVENGSGITQLPTVSATSVTVSAPSAQPIARTQILTSGRTDDGGYDIDVFWCQGGSPAAQSQRYANAGRMAQALSVTANAASASPRLGRIRLRPLPEAAQARPGYNITNNLLRFEPGERGVADALFSQIRSIDSSVEPREQRGNPPPTPNYLSVFFCAG